MFIPVGFGVATLVFDIPGPGSPAMVTLGYDADLLESADDNAAGIRTAWNASGSMRTQMDSSATHRETRVLRRSSLGDLVAGIDTTSQAGGAAGTGAPPQVAMLFQKSTGLAGRNRRGRLYLPAPIAVAETGVWSAAQITGANNSAAIFLAALATDDNPMFLLHTSEVDPPNEVTALQVAPVVATQRRRIR